MCLLYVNLDNIKSMDGSRKIKKLINKNKTQSNVLGKTRNKVRPEIFVVLENIRSAHNVGSIFRTSDAVGVSKIFLCGYTPAPEDRFGRERADISKVALGAEKTLAWEHFENATDLIKKLKKNGAHIVAVEQAPNSVSIKTIKTKPKTVFIFGNETEGLPQNILKLCDEIAEIPMRGKKESLNVSVSVAIALYLTVDL